MKTQMLKAPVAMVFPVVGTSEDGKKRKIRVSSKQPYSLAVVGFRLTPEQAIDAATALLNQAKIAQASDHTVLDVLARRKSGPGTLIVQTTFVPPEKKKRAKTRKRAKKVTQESVEAAAAAA